MIRGAVRACACPLEGDHLRQRPWRKLHLIMCMRTSCRAHLSSGFGDEVEGNRHMWRILNQCANTAVKAKESIFEIGYQR